jgi:hypothetical protein
VTGKWFSALNGHPWCSTVSTAASPAFLGKSNWHATGRMEIGDGEETVARAPAFVTPGLSELKNLPAVMFVGPAADAVDIFFREELRSSESCGADEDLRHLFRHQHCRLDGVG